MPQNDQRIRQRDLKFQTKGLSTLSEKEFREEFVKDMKSLVSEFYVKTEEDAPPSVFDDSIFATKSPGKFVILRDDIPVRKERPLPIRQRIYQRIQEIQTLKTRACQDTDLEF